MKTLPVARVDCLLIIPIVKDGWKDGMCRYENTEGEGEGEGEGEMPKPKYYLPALAKRSGYTADCCESTIGVGADFIMEYACTVVQLRTIAAINRLEIIAKNHRFVSASREASSSSPSAAAPLAEPFRQTALLAAQFSDLPGQFGFPHYGLWNAISKF
ncbi:hypothetical protein V9T40_014223 [Parthenolecanium corni]|uniref:Uncharacterized protein n=1 Tax=Parthenolecanium corni TaxID=536013 RepID=A0AAN9TCK4_9HEMI